MSLPFVPGGPEPSTNGFSNFMPLTVMDRSAVTRASTVSSGKRVGYHGAKAASTRIFPSGNRGAGAPGDSRGMTTRSVRWSRATIEQMRVGGLVALAALCGCDKLLDLQSVPEPFVAASGTSTVAAGTGHTCWLDSHGALWCWGENDIGQVGNGTTQPDV